MDCTYCCNSTFLIFQATLLYLCVCPFAEVVLWEDRLQQGHVQQVDQGGQDTRRRPEDIQDCTCEVYIELLPPVVGGLCSK